MRRYIYDECQKEFYGYIGEKTGCENYRVGDLVLFNINIDTNGIGIIVKNNKEKEYCIYGWCGRNSSIEKTYKINKIIIPNSLITENIISYLHQLSVKECEVKEMTLEEIEEKLGYKIKIKK